MHRTAPRLLGDVDALIAEARRRHPQWSALIEPLREMAAALDDPVWAEAARRAVLPAARAERAPILEGARISPPAGSVAQLLAALGGASHSPEDALRLVAAAIRQGGTRPGDASALAVRAALAAMPLLQACAREHGPRIPEHWPHGYCPVCGAWPVLAELVGVDRARRLRCGRCAAAWAIPWLACPYCGERDHERLGSLVPAATRETRRVETCATCHGYVKTLTTLLPRRPLELALDDLDTVELDLAAVDHGFARPGALGYELNVVLEFPC